VPELFKNLSLQGLPAAMVQHNRNRHNPFAARAGADS
jgi:hypothetical protein